MSEGYFFAAAGRLDRAVEFFAPGIEYVDRQRAKTRRRRNGEALLHVADERRRRALERRERGPCGDRRKRRPRDPVAGRPPFGRFGLRDHVGTEDKPVRSRPANAREVDVETARHAPRGLIGQHFAAPDEPARGPRVWQSEGSRP